MKISFRLILAILAATAALAGCTKEVTSPNFENDKVNPAAEGSRVIAVSFAPQTKTTLEEGLQPRFANGDSILLFTVPEDENETLLTDIRKVKVDGSGNATISTNLTGTLKAFYPASAAVVKNNIVIGEISAVQSGKFADANIAGADINENNSAQFENVAPLLIITPPSGTKKLIVRSLRTIGEGGQRFEMAFPINTSAEEKEQCAVTVLNPDSDGKYYVTLYFDYDVKLSDLSFEAWFDDGGTTGSIKGIPASKIAQQAAATGIEDYEFIQPGIAYTIDDKNWHEYVEVGGHKWATMNMGATSPTNYGKYFAWGETIGHSLKSETPISDIVENAFADNYSFETAPNIGNPATLPLDNDAAYANWGGSWRMPTSQEFQDLYDACGGTDNTPKPDGSTSTTEKGVYWCASYDGVAGLLFIAEDNGPHLFFPAAGDGDDTYLYGAGSICNYWSSSLDSSKSGRAYRLIFDGDCVYPQNSRNRCYGFSIRPVADMPADPSEPSEPEEESPATEMTEEVLF